MALRETEVDESWSRAINSIPDEPVRDPLTQTTIMTDAAIERMRGEAFAAGMQRQREIDGASPKSKETSDPIPVHRAIANHRHIGGMGFLRDQVFWLGDD